MLTLAEHIALMRQAVGFATTTGHDLYETFNRAGRYLYQHHNWSWKMTGPTDLAAVGDQDFINLPSDFHQCVSLYIDNSAGDAATYTCVELVDLPTIANLRQNSFNNIDAGPFRVHIPAWTQSDSPDQTPKIRALVYPTPTDDGSPTMQLIYLRRWREMTSSNTTALPNIPLDFEQALILIARAFAMRIESPESGNADMTMREFEMNVQQLKAYDGQRQLDYGPIQGGAGSRSQLVPMFNVGTITL